MQSVLISGAAQGIGAAATKLFYLQGFKVGIYDINAAQARLTGSAARPECQSRPAGCSRYPALAERPAGIQPVGRRTEYSGE